LKRARVRRPCKAKKARDAIVKVLRSVVVSEAERVLTSVTESARGPEVNERSQRITGAEKSAKEKLTWGLRGIVFAHDPSAEPVEKHEERDQRCHEGGDHQQVQWPKSLHPGPLHKPIHFEEHVQNQQRPCHLDQVPSLKER